MEEEMARYNLNIVEKVDTNKKCILPNLRIETREYLDITLKTNGNNMLLVIMMNPSIADNMESDETINSIIEHFGYGYSSVNNNKHGIQNVKYISVVNLFSICCQKSKELNSIINKIHEETNGNVKISKNIINNRNIIKDKIFRSNYVVLGWGDCPENFYETTFHREIINVIDFIKEFKKNDIYIFHIKNLRAAARGVSSENILTNRKNPVHPSNGDIISLLKVKIDGLYRIIPN
jgi:hypothetical protein